MIKKILKLIELIKAGKLDLKGKNLEDMYGLISEALKKVPEEKATKMQEKVDELFSKGVVEEENFIILLVQILLELNLLLLEVEVELDVDMNIIKDNKIKLEIKDNELLMDNSKDGRIFVTVFNFGNIGSKNTLYKDINIGSNNEEDNDTDIDVEENELEIKDNKLEIEENELIIADNKVDVELEKEELIIKDNKGPVKVEKEFEVKDNEFEIEL